MTTSSTSATASTTTADALDRARELAGAWLDGAARAPGARRRRAGGPARAAARERCRPGRGRRRARRRGRARPRRQRRPALLRLRHRRLAPRGAGRRLAHVRLGPEQRASTRCRPRPRRPRRRSATGCKALLGLPAGAASGLTTGAQMANVTALAAARHAVLARAGWDVEARGLGGAPPLRVIAGAEAHSTVFNALRLLGIGRDTARPRRRRRSGPHAPRRAGAPRCEDGRPTIVCAQAGNVNTGACDPLGAIAAACRAARRLAARRRRVRAVGGGGARARAHLVAGAAAADSWAVDAHKWLNVPYDGAFAFVADPDALRAAMTLTGPYLQVGAAHERNGSDWSPEASRRARAFPIWAALRAARARGRRRAGRAPLPARRPASPSGWRPSRAWRSSTTSCSTRRSPASATTTRPPTPWSPRSRPTARAGSAAPAGRAVRRCGSPSRAGPPARRTPTARRTPSWRPGGRSADA